MDKTILVVDDNASDNHLYSAILKKKGYNVLSAKSGMEAIATINSIKIDVVLLDHQMPGMDGVSTFERIQQISEPPVVIMVTGYEDSLKLAIEFMQKGGSDFVPKPIDFDVLSLKIKKAIERRELEQNLLEAKKTAESIRNDYTVRLLQSEKMASIGQLASGVAHEINNPIGFVNSNLNTLSEYQEDMSDLILDYKKLLKKLENLSNHKGLNSVLDNLNQIQEKEQNIDIDYILNDAPMLIKECQEGTERIKKIVVDLKDFAHPGSQKLDYADINQCIDSTLNVVWNEIKYKATVNKKYGDLPKVKCYPQQLNQVFMNLLVNAAQAIEKKGIIHIETKLYKDNIIILIQDTGIGIPKENIAKIFDPFFTTKEVGKGTGLGLHVVYNIIKKHKGHIKIKSVVGKGTVFQIQIPVNTN